MTINATILNEMWKARNLFKHEKKKITTVNIISNIKRNLKEVITIHNKKKKWKNQLSINLSRNVLHRQRFMHHRKQFYNF